MNIDINRRQYALQAKQIPVTGAGYVEQMTFATDIDGGMRSVIHVDKFEWGKCLGLEADEVQAEAVLESLRSAFPAYGCGCSHDCCGCRQYHPVRLFAADEASNSLIFYQDSLLNV